MKVGFVGVGNMGGPMCRNIIRNTNNDVVVFDLDPAAIEACTSLGAR
ncbi:MAG: NAD(P)-dependent oxidoreductase, partial [Rhodospirillales bacterium]|nr:NAD(P)-dependent oxidoreductase [Rhodospirillales bacterium]